MRLRAANSAVPRAALLLSLALVLPLAARAQPLAVVDDSGATVALPAPARRVVALGPHLVEQMYAAGGGARLVGVLRYSDHPPEAQALPVVGDAVALNLEAIARLKPDLVLVWHSGINSRLQDKLAALGVPVFRSETTRVADIARTLRQIGQLLGTAPQAEAAAAQVQADWAALQQRWAGRAPVRVFYQLWHEPLMTVSGRHLIHEAITACGGRNVFAGLAPLVPTVSWEAAVRANPELVVSGSARDEPARLQAWQRFPQVQAVARGRVLSIDSDALARMSPRFVPAAARLCQAIDTARR